MPNTAAQLATHPDASTAHQIVVERPLIDAAKLSGTIYQTVFQSLDGPMGVKPADMIAALGALAGYSARWMVIRQISNGQIEDDFAAPKGCNMPFISISSHVNQMITDLTRDSFAGVLTNSMIAAGAGWLPNMSVDVNHNFVDIDSPEFPDYSVDKQYWPQLPPQALLLMMWESHARILAHTAGAEDVALDAYALAITRTATESKEDLPMDRAGQIALETAIAMAKLKYAF